MKKSKRSLFLLIFPVAWILIGPVIFTGAAMCDGSCGSAPSGDQATWNYDVYKFLNECGQGHYPAYEPDISGMNVFNQTPAYSQTAGDGAANFWLSQGNRLYSAGSYRQAEASYANAVKLDPSLLEGWLNMGNARYFMGRYKDSLYAYDAVLKLDPQNANALQGKEEVLLALNRTDRG